MANNILVVKAPLVSDIFLVSMYILCLHKKHSRALSSGGLAEQATHQNEYQRLIFSSNERSENGFLKN